MAAPLSSPTHVNGAQPWPGLASFTEDARQFFHGRTKEVDTLFRHARRRLLTVLFGQSGLGKSSLLQAGLFPKLRRDGFLPIYLRLDHAPDAPAYGKQIRAALVCALTDAEASTLPTEEETVWEFFHRRELTLNARDGLPVTPVFVLDQFEEIFTLTHGDTETKARASRLLNDLADLVENRVPAALEERMEHAPELSERYEFRREDYRVILSLREDYLPHLESLRELIPSLMQNRMRLHRMNGEQARDAVLKPGGDLVTPAVAEAILRFVSGARLDDPAVDVAGMEIEPPLLSLVCHELNNQRLTLGQPRITTDLLAGSSTAILRDFYERCLTDQPPAVRRFIEDDLLTDSGFRENVALERANKLLARDGAPADAIPRLVDRRLLHIEERLNLRRVELTHDVLAGVVRASRDSRRAREEKEVADQRALDAERRERDARRHLWRARRAIAVTALLFVAALVSAILAFYGQKKATHAEHAAQTAENRAHEDEAKFRRMAIQADYTFATDALARDDAATSIGYLGRILRTAPDERPAAALLWSLLRDRNWCLPLLPPLTHRDGLNTVEYSPDGTELLTSSKDCTARLWDARTGAPIGEPLRHTAEVLKAIFSPDGRRVATASADSTARVWDTHTGLPVTPPIRHADSVPDLAFSPDGTRLATVSDDKTVGLWDATTGQSISSAWPLKFSDGTTAVCFSPNGTRLLVGTSGGFAAILDAVSGAPIGQTLRHQPGTVYVAYSPDGKLVATASDDKTAQLWNAQTGQPVGGPLSHKQAVMEVMFSPDSQRLLTASDDMTAAVWDVATGQPVGQPMRHAHFIWRAAFSPDGRRILTTSFDGTARLWDADTGKALSEPMRHGSAVYYGSFSPDGTRVVTASLDHTAQVWDARRGSRLTPVFRHPDFVRDAEFSPDGRTVATASHDGTARLWDTHDGQAIGQAMEHRDRVTKASFSPNGRQVLTAADDGSAGVWSATDGQPIGELFQQDDAVRDAVFSPDGARIATAGHSARVWELASHQPIGTPMPDKEGIFSVCFSPDGRQVATASAEGITGIWNAATGQPLFPPIHQDGIINNARYDPAGKRIITGCFDGNANIWDSHTGVRLAGPMHHDNAVWGVAFSPDGTRVATTSFDRTARLWNAATGQPASPALKHGAEVCDTQFSPDGARLATASFDGTARLWDVGSGLPLAVPLAHTDRVYHARFSPNGQSVLTASRDRTARLWDVHMASGMPPGWFLALAEAVGGKHLDDNDAFASVPAARILELREEATTTNAGDWSRFARWFFADRATRTVSPFFDWTAAAFVAAQAEDGTLPALQEALEVQPCDPLLLARLARVEPDGAHARFDADFAQMKAPRDADVFLQIALALDHLGGTRDALLAINTALQLAPTRAGLDATRGDLLWHAGDRVGALAALDKAVQLAPQDVVVLADRGLKRALSGDATGASADFLAAFRVSPQRRETDVLDGWALLHLGDCQGAANQFKAAGHLGLSGLAACGWQAGTKDEAVKTFLALLKITRADAGPDPLRGEATALGLTEQELNLLEAVRAATVEKHPEFKD